MSRRRPSTTGTFPICCPATIPEPEKTAPRPPTAIRTPTVRNRFGPASSHPSPEVAANRLPCVPPFKSLLRQHVFYAQKNSRRQATDRTHHQPPQTELRPHRRILGGL